MSYVIVEVTDSFMGTSVVVVGPFNDERTAEMERRSRHLGRTLDPSVNASQTKSYAREVAPR